MFNPHHEFIRADQGADLETAWAVLRGADKDGELSGSIATVESVRRVLAEAHGLDLTLLVHNAKQTA